MSLYMILIIGRKKLFLISQQLLVKKTSRVMDNED